MSVFTGKQHADILLAVAARAGRDARAAWRRARATPNLANLRAAFRACVIAVQCVNRAAADAHNAPLAPGLRAKAREINAAIETLKPKYSDAFLATL